MALPVDDHAVVPASRWDEPSSGTPPQGMERASVEGTEVRLRAGDDCDAASAGSPPLLDMVCGVVRGDGPVSSTPALAWQDLELLVPTVTGKP